MDWAKIMETAGIAGISFAILFYGFKLFNLFIAQWKSSTDSVNKNTEAFTQLSSVLERSSEREIQFQQDVLQKLEESHRLSRDTNEKVSDMHNRLQ